MIMVSAGVVYSPPELYKRVGVKVATEDFHDILIIPYSVQ